MDGGRVQSLKTNSGTPHRPADSEQSLSTKIPIEGLKINPLRLVIVARLIFLGFFFHMRITKPVKDAYGLWITAVICEFWLAASWILDQLPKWSPITRRTYHDRLSNRYEKEGEDHCGLASVDVILSAQDPIMEPPLMTANAILSVLAVDYPANKVSCYVSDDGSAMVTFECLSETAEFARRWVPFCKEFDIEPRAPEAYFSLKIDYLGEKVKPSFVKQRRKIKREYEEFKVGINALMEKRKKAPEEGWMMQDGRPWPGNNPCDHPGMIQVFLGRTGAMDIRGNELPLLVYVSREKKPRFHHHNRPGAMNALVRVSGVLTNSPYILSMDCTQYINNSKVIREAMCFMMDPLVSQNVSYVQFPLRLHSLQQENKYAYHNTVFYDITMKGLDGVQGPICLGTGCVFKRLSLYGYAPPLILQTHSETYSHQYESETTQLLVPLQSLEEYFGQSPVFITSTLMKDGGVSKTTYPSSVLIKEAIHVITCTYEDKTEWGKEIGWIYGSITDNILTGMKMHAHGWKSIYCIPSRPAFKENGAMNLGDTLRQLLKWASGSMEIILSNHCPLWYRVRSKQFEFLQRIAYINIVIYPLASIPLIVYCFLPAVCLLTGKFIFPQVDGIDILWVITLLISMVACVFLELKWSQVDIEEWWRNQQFWVIGGTSSHFFAIFQVLFKVLIGIEIASATTLHANPRSKYLHETEDLNYFYALKWKNLLILPTMLVIVNFIAVVAGVSATFNSAYGAWGSLFKKLCFALWVVIHLYPFLRGLLGRQNRTPTIVIIWSMLLASIFSLLWIKIDPFLKEEKVPTIQKCNFDCS